MATVLMDWGPLSGGGYTALQLAVINCTDASVDLLLEHKADVGTKNDYGPGPRGKANGSSGAKPERRKGVALRPDRPAFCSVEGPRLHRRAAAEARR